MGRTNGKLIPFLRDGLIYKKYINLVLEESGETFYVELPRYEIGMNLEYHRLLQDWYEKNNRTFGSYSAAKAVLKAALKKSVYLISLPSLRKILRFRYANADEVAEKRRLQKNKNVILPSSVGSSNYHGDESDTSFDDQTVPDQEITFADITMSNLDNILHTNGETCEKDPISLDFQEDTDFDITHFNWKEFCDINLSNVQLNDQLSDLDFDTEDNVQVDLPEILQANSGQMNPNIVMNELCTNGSPVQVSSDVPKKWIYIDKINLGSIVQYIFQSNLPYLNKLGSDQLRDFPVDIGNPGEQIDVLIPVEKWVDVG